MVNLINTIIQATLQLIFLAGCGFILFRKAVLNEQILQTLSKLLVNFIFPAFIFSQLLANFAFRQFPFWWVYPFVSMLIILVSFLLGKFFLWLYPQIKARREFLASVTFSNAGYLPLVLIGALFSGALASRLFIYLFLFLLGFNLLIWSYGVILLVGKKEQEQAWLKLFSPPVIAIILGLIAVFLKLNIFMPLFLKKSLGMIGNCALPLAMLIVGANLACIKMEKLSSNHALQLVVAIKLVLFPLLGTFVVLFLKIDPLVKFLIFLQASMPTAVSLSVICRSFGLEGKFANQAVFWTHIFSMVSLPVLLFIFRTIAHLA